MIAASSGLFQLHAYLLVGPSQRSRHHHCHPLQRSYTSFKKTNVVFTVKRNLLRELFLELEAYFWICSTWQILSLLGQLEVSETDH